MTTFNPQQKILFSAEYLLDIHPLKKYELLFDNLNSSPLEKPLSEGRPPVSKSGLLRALVYKNLKPLPTLYDLAVELVDNPALSLKFGLNPPQHPSPLVERLSSFLRDTTNDSLQQIRKSLVRELIQLEQITGRFLSIDSCPILANVKENNLKTSVKDRFDKTKFPKGDPDCRLSVIIHFPQPFKKEELFFWGYRNHTITDTLSELPVWESTKPANVSESKMFIPLFSQTQEDFNLPIEGVIGDAIYDAEYILNFVVKELKAKPYIARNPRWESKSDITTSHKGGLICIAGFDMIYWGKFKDRGKIRKKFVCPITHRKKFAQQIPQCPWNHPKFVKGNGCIAYRREDENIRNSIDYGSESFKKIYNLRTSSERIFSRLLTLCMQDPSVIGLNATANHCTIAHITILLIALTATKTGNKDKIRFVKKFLPNL
jgi:hypothetical protein